MHIFNQSQLKNSVIR